MQAKQWNERSFDIGLQISAIWAWKKKQCVETMLFAKILKINSMVLITNNSFLEVS